MSSLIHRHGFVAFAAVLACLSSTRPAAAHETSSTPPDQGTPWGLGIGVVVTQRPYAGVGDRTYAFPLVTYENERVRLAGTAADLKLGSAGPLRFALRARYALGDGYRSGDAPVLAGMQNRVASLRVGPAVEWNAGDAKFSLEWLDDVLRKSRGLQARLGVEREFRLGPLVLTPHLAATYVDRRYVGYYYGVTTAEATSARPACDGRATLNLEAGLRTAYAFDPSNVVFADFGAQALGRGITRSPLVDRKVTPSIVLGYSYRF